MAPGRPRKKPRNISGLRNQPDRLSPLPGSHLKSDGTAPHSTPSQSHSRAPSPDDQYFPDRHDLANSEVGSEIDQDESGEEEQDFWEDLDDEEFRERLIKMAVEDDPKDVDWIPLKKKGKAKVWVRIDVDWRGEQLYGSLP